MNAGRGGFKVSPLDQRVTTVIGIFGGWALGALIAFQWGGYPADLCLGMASALSKRLHVGDIEEHGVLAFANVADISLAFRYVLMPMMFCVLGHDAEPAVVVVMAVTHQIFSE